MPLLLRHCEPLSIATTTPSVLKSLSSSLIIAIGVIQVILVAQGPVTVVCIRASEAEVVRFKGSAQEGRGRSDA